MTQILHKLLPFGLENMNLLDSRVGSKVGGLSEEDILKLVNELYGGNTKVISRIEEIITQPEMSPREVLTTLIALKVVEKQSLYSHVRTTAKYAIDIILMRLASTKNRKPNALI